MKAIFTILFLIVFNLVSFAQQNGVTITPDDGKFIICVPADGKVKLKAKLIVPANHPGVKKFTVKWGSMELKEFTDINAKLEQDIDLSEFVKNCKSDEAFDVKLKTENVDGTADNNAYEITFKNIPRPDFKLITVCSGKEVTFVNLSCPRTNDIKYLWNYDKITNTDGKFTFTQTGTFPVTLTATNSCAPNGVAITKNIKVISPAKAMIVDSGHVAVRPNPVTMIDTLFYCFDNGGGIFRIDGVTKSEGEPDYFEWRISGGQYQYLEKTHDNSPRPKVQLLEKDKIYTIELRVNNACGQLSPWVKCFHILKDVPALTLNHQEDRCAKFTYKPSPFLKDAVYKVNGQLLLPSGELPVDIAPKRYIVEATLNNLCGNQILKDSFFVAPAQEVSIISPSQNISVCSGADSISLETNFTDGTWDKSDYIKSINGKNFFFPSDTGTFVITYRHGKDICEKTASKTIQVKGVSVKADDKSICSGDSFIRLTANLKGGVWTTNDCANCIKGDTLILTNVSKTSLTVEYTITGANGCSSKTSARINIGKPKARFDLKGGCPEKIAPLKNLSSGATTFIWTVNNNKVDEANVISSLKTGTNIVKLQAIAGTCSSDTTATIIITAPPHSISFSINTLVECSPFTPTISVTDTPEANVTYTWDIGDGKPVNQFNPPVHTFQNSGYVAKTFTIKFKAENSCGTVEALPQTITVKPLAKAEIGIDSTVFRCSPAVVTLTDRSQGADLGNWYFGNNIPVPLKEKVITREFLADRDQLINMIIRLEVENTCGKSADSVKIQIYPITIKPYFEISKSTGICPGEKIQFKDATTPIPTHWIWKVNGVVFANDSIPKFAFDQENTTYTIMMIAQNGCIKDSVERKVITRNKPKSTLNVKGSIACENTPFTFENTSDPQYLFKWNFGDNEQDSSLFLVKHTYTKAGTYVVKLDIFDAGKSCKDSSFARVTVLAKPKPDFEIANGTSFLCSPATVRFNDKSTDATEWLWKIGKDKESTARNPEFVMDKGQYQVQLTVGNGFCKDSVMSQALLTIDSCVVYLPQVFTPNNDGVSDRFNIFGNDPMVKLVVSLRVFDRWGEVVYDGVDLKPNTHNEGWDGTFKEKEMPVGTYPYQTKVRFADDSTRTFTGVIKLIR
ncbi:PKD domain-containing protein [Emticicia fontis]